MTSNAITLATSQVRAARQSRTWLDRARAVAPVIAEWRDAADQHHHLPEPLVDSLARADMFTLAADREVGGAEVRDERLVRVVEELSRHDGSVGWNVAIAATTAIIATHLPNGSLQQAFATDPKRTVFAGGLLPKGTAEALGDGFRLNGRWTFASGCRQANWFFAPSVVVADGEPRLRADGHPDIRVFCVPTSACEILETWDTLGLRGTGSHDVEIKDVLVGEEWTFPIVLEGPGQPGAVHLANLLPYAAPAVAAVALGIARGAIDAFMRLALDKTPALGTVALVRQHTIHERVGRAEALLSAARALLYATVRELPRTGNWSAPVDDDLKARIRLASAHAAQSATDVVALLYTAAGTSSIFVGSVLERSLRDVHVVAQHAAVAPSNIEMVGQYLLGQGLQIRR
ncbi:MAG TPA: acyl-CoA dehydrogenase family protein [Chloroflexota bacterium]|jgi:alkylation response protein AidB-like acyl-CoA dehydrogenase